jgi:hypothetical protein
MTKLNPALIPVAYTSEKEIKAIAGSALMQGRFFAGRDNDTPIALYALTDAFVADVSAKLARLEWLEEKYARLDRIAEEQFRQVQELKIENKILKGEK